MLMDSLGYIAVPYIFLLWFGWSVQDGIKTTIKRNRELKTISRA